MELVLPNFGLFFWATILFLMIFLILRKFAWSTILKAISDREASIEASLQAAEQARDEMSRLQSDNQKLLEEARRERDAMLKEARELREKMIGEARETAAAEGSRQIESARKQIQSEKMAAITELKNEVGRLSIEVAEKILRKKMEDGTEQEATVTRLINEMHFN
jgi:F-type H+-transporting ATPase subunit b